MADVPQHTLHDAPSAGHPAASASRAAVVRALSGTFVPAARAWRARLARVWRRSALAVLACVLVMAIIVASAIGSVPISPLRTAQILLNATHLVHFRQAWPASDEIILWQLRFPRVLGAALVGAALGVSGTLFQGLLRNPLADPLLLGTSSGAALGATIAFLVPAFFTAEWLGFGMVAVFAFVGALLAVVVVYRLASRGGRAPVVTLLLAGVAVSAVLTAVQTLLVTVNASLSMRVVALYVWIAGGINVDSWAQVAVVFVLALAGTVAALFLAPALDAFALGEEMASYLGLHIERYKLLIVAVASLLVAAAVSISGLVGFVGLVSPHLCRITLGPRHRLLIPASALVGAIFVVVADLLARVALAPSELPLGVVTALVGAPFFLSLLRHAGDRYGW